MSLPESFKYTKSHEWISIENNVATVGITEFAVGQLGDITLVEISELDEQVNVQDSFGTIESVKAVSELYAPLSGKVAEANEELEDEPELVNDDCYKAGWIAKIELSDVAQVDGLLDASAYQEYLDSLD